MTRRKQNTTEETIDPVVLDKLLTAISPQAAPAGLRASLMQRVHTAETAHPGPATVRANGGWKRLSPEIEVKLLCVDVQARTKSFLLRARAGTRMPAHGHRCFEECLVLEGDFRFGDLTLRTGDFHCVPAGALHPEAYTRDGVLVYIRSHLEDYRDVLV